MLTERMVTDSLLIAPQAMTNSATVTASIDTQGANYATIRVALASEINTNAVGPTLSLLHSDDATTYVTTVADRTAEAIVAAKEVTYGIDLRGKKRYLKLSVTTATTTNDDVTLAAIATLSCLEQRPNGTTDAGDVVVYA